MNTDRELLELAAKAAGISIRWSSRPMKDHDGYIYHQVFAQREGFTGEWNPREDDGDALRLAAGVPDLNISWVFGEAWRQFPLAADNQAQRREYIRHRIVACAAGHGRSLP